MIREFGEMLVALSAEGVRFVVVGGYAVGAHLEPRATKDIDILVEPTKENARRVLRALERFGAPSFGATMDDLSRPGFCLQIGVPPRRIDLITGITGVDFREAWASRIEVRIPGASQRRAPVLGAEALIRNKRAVGRPQDLVDADKLERALRSRKRRKR